MVTADLRPHALANTKGYVAWRSRPPGSPPRGLPPHTRPDGKPLRAARRLAQAAHEQRSHSAASPSGPQNEEAQLRFGSQNGAATFDELCASPNGAAAITLHYASSWRAPTMLYSLQGGEWGQCTLDEVASSAGQWKAATFSVNGSAASPSAVQPPLLEFVITDGGSNWDKPIDGSNYMIHAHGRFTLRDGQIAPVADPAVLVVSDLDDTMIGDDTATAVFKRFWERDAVPRGSRLVYNTGRALHKCEALFQEKRDVLPQPDHLITSVGTKVYSRTATGWEVDEEHAALLDEGWDLEVVREAAYAALAAAGRERMHFRPPDEQNEHKVTCGVALEALDPVLGKIRRALKHGGVRAKLITSGSGNWRFLDIVSANAGKLQAMEHVRRKLGFHHNATVACGDSGNDIAMFEGANRGILVSNSQPDLLDWLEARRKEGDDDGRLLLAGAERARGILEGLAHFGFL